MCLFGDRLRWCCGEVVSTYYEVMCVALSRFADGTPLSASSARHRIPSRCVCNKEGKLACNYPANVL
jgi:hypothetical protein